MNDLISRQAAIDAIGEKPFAGTADEYEYEQGLQNQWERDVVAIKILPPAQPDKRLEKIADLVEGTIDHFDRDDAMGLLYQIKEVLNER